MNYKTIMMCAAIAGTVQQTWGMQGQTPPAIPIRTYPFGRGNGRGFIPKPSLWDDDATRAMKEAAWSELHNQKPKTPIPLYVPVCVCTHGGTSSSDEGVAKVSRETQTTESAITQNNDGSMIAKDSTHLIAEIAVLRKQLEDLQVNTQQQLKIDELKKAEYDWDELRE